MSLTLHTSLGDIKIELECAAAPRLCENFLALAASGTYDGTLFHRNVLGFLVQGGDPTGTGKGGESIAGTKLADEFHASLKVCARFPTRQSSRLCPSRPFCLHRSTMPEALLQWLAPVRTRLGRRCVVRLGKTECLRTIMMLNMNIPAPTHARVRAVLYYVLEAADS